MAKGYADYSYFQSRVGQIYQGMYALQGVTDVHTVLTCPANTVMELTYLHFNIMGGVCEYLLLFYHPVPPATGVTLYKILNPPVGVPIIIPRPIYVVSNDFIECYMKAAVGGVYAQVELTGQLLEYSVFQDITLQFY